MNSNFKFQFTKAGAMALMAAFVMVSLSSTKVQAGTVGCECFGEIANTDSSGSPNGTYSTTLLYSNTDKGTSFNIQVFTDSDAVSSLQTCQASVANYPVCNCLSQGNHCP